MLSKSMEPLLNLTFFGPFLKKDAENIFDYQQIMQAYKEAPFSTKDKFWDDALVHIKQLKIEIFKNSC